jgi:hypothetical protein
MSLEQALADNTAALKAHTAVMTTVAANQDRLLVGQQAAIDKIEGGGKGGKGKPAETKETKTDKKNTATETADADVKKTAVAWMEGKDDAAKKAAGAFLADMLAHFGCGGKLTGPESKLNAEQRKQAKFYIERKAAGLPVDFNAEYDFDGDPKQGAAAAEEDPLG